MDEVKEWQNRPLEAVYPILSLDVKMVKISAQGYVVTKLSIWPSVWISKAPKKSMVLGQRDRGLQVLAQGVERTQEKRFKYVFLACMDMLTEYPNIPI